MKDVINLIVAKKLHITTLEPRMSDELDFHELSVGQIKEALEMAYLAGRDSMVTRGITNGRSKV